MRLQETARTSAFVLKFRAEKPGDPGPWAVSPLKLPFLSENTSQSVLFPASFIGEVGRNDSALLLRSSFLHSVPCSQPSGGPSTSEPGHEGSHGVGWLSCSNGPKSATYRLTEKRGC